MAQRQFQRQPRQPKRRPTLTPVLMTGANGRRQHAAVDLSALPKTKYSRGHVHSLTGVVLTDGRTIRLTGAKGAGALCGTIDEFRAFAMGILDQYGPIDESSSSPAGA